MILSTAKDLNTCKVLDIGCGSGHIAYHISKVAAQVIGINISDERVLKEGYEFKRIPESVQ